MTDFRKKLIIALGAVFAVLLVVTAFFAVTKKQDGNSSAKKIDTKASGFVFALEKAQIHSSCSEKRLSNHSVRSVDLFIFAKNRSRPPLVFP